VDLHPFVNREDEVRAVYRKSAVNMNMTSEQMPTSVNQRVWDVPACKGFLVTDAQEDALLFFKEEEEIIVYRTLEEAKEKTEYYLNHPGKREKIMQKAYVKVMTEHVITHRLQQIVKIMKNRFR
jgi:spore maturation protein CgeB